ncbi:hypothetical protein C8R44DRAFT_728005 [Mycena epipterygia]|nr:hypothetical protein C8R44DRAFT_728005 [Mycena epipterygia]
MLSRDQPPQREGQGSFRNITPRSQAFEVDTTSPERPKRKRESNSAEFPKAKKQQTERKYSYCPVCHRPFTETTSRNSHIGKDICVAVARRRQLPVPASFDGLKSSNRLDSLKGSSDRFEAAEEHMEISRRRGVVPPVTGPPSYRGHATAVQVPVKSQKASHSPFATWSREVSQSPPFPTVQEGVVPRGTHAPILSGATRFFPDRHVLPQQPRSSPHSPAQMTLQRSVSYPTLQQLQHRAAPPLQATSSEHLANSTGISRSTSWIQPQLAYRKPAPLQASASLGGHDVRSAYRSNESAFSALDQPRHQASQPEYNLNGCTVGASGAVAAALHHQQRPSGPSQVAAHAVPPHIFVPAPLPFYSRPQVGRRSPEAYAPYQTRFYAGLSQVQYPAPNSYPPPNSYAPGISHDGPAQVHHASEPESPWRPVQVRYTWNVYAPGDSGLSRIPSPRTLDHPRSHSGTRTASSGNVDQRRSYHDQLGSSPLDGYTADERVHDGWASQDGSSPKSYTTRDSVLPAFYPQISTPEAEPPQVSLQSEPPPDTFVGADDNSTDEYSSSESESPAEATEDVIALPEEYTQPPAHFATSPSGSTDDADDAVEDSYPEEAPEETQVSYLEAIDIIAAIGAGTYLRTPESAAGASPAEDPPRTTSPPQQGSETPSPGFSSAVGPDTPSDLFEQPFPPVSWDELIGSLSSSQGSSAYSSGSPSASPWNLPLTWSC